MEHVLEIYHRKYEDYEELVCLDETSKKLVQETRLPLLGQPGRAHACDCGYQRGYVSNLFMLFVPLDRMAADGGQRAPPGPIGVGWFGNWWMKTTLTRTASSYAWPE